jgi:hypothetical protein
MLVADRVGIKPDAIGIFIGPLISIFMFGEALFAAPSF